MRPSTPTQPAAKPAAPAPKQLSRMDWENKMASTIDELLHNNDMKVRRWLGVNYFSPNVLHIRLKMCLKKMRPTLQNTCSASLYFTLLYVVWTSQKCVYHAASDFEELSALLFMLWL